MHATVKITMDNAAFETPNTELEIAGILRELAAKVEVGILKCNLRDSNGNTVGHFKVVGQPRRFGR